MKSITYRLALSATSLASAAVVFALGASAAYAQDQLVANIPFAFRAGQTTLSAGRYNLAPNSDSNKSVLVLHNAVTQEGTLILAQNPIYESKDNRPRIVFRCDSAGCAISQVFKGSNGWEFPTPKMSRAEKERLSVIYLTRGTSAD